MQTMQLYRILILVYKEKLTNFYSVVLVCYRENITLFKGLAKIVFVSDIWTFKIYLLFFTTICALLLLNLGFSYLFSFKSVLCYNIMFLVFLHFLVVIILLCFRSTYNSLLFRCQIAIFECNNESSRLLL